MRLFFKIIILLVFLNLGLGLILWPLETLWTLALSRPLQLLYGILFLLTGLEAVLKKK
jgi:hypothetical protein